MRDDRSRIAAAFGGVILVALAVIDLLWVDRSRLGAHISTLGFGIALIVASVADARLRRRLD